MTLQIKNISVNFSGIIALSDLSFDVKERSITGLIGPNGAGKTTLFNAISRIINPQSGDILWQGESLLRCKEHDIAKKGIYRTFQTPEIFKRLTVLENLLVGAHLSFKCNLVQYALSLSSSRSEETKQKNQALGMLDQLGLSQYANHVADSIPLVFQRRLEIGRALSSGPSLLLLDEPTAGMTSEEKEDVIHFISQIRQGTGITVIIIEHDIKLIRKLCSHIVVLNFGRKIAEGDPEQVSNHKEVIKAYLGEV